MVFDNMAIFGTELQQHLPLTVLKHNEHVKVVNHYKLQQHLPLTVLKLYHSTIDVLRIESCNSTYR